MKLPLLVQPKSKHLPEEIRNPGGIVPQLREVLRSLVSGIDPWPLFIHGPPGGGKTCAALCLLDYVAGAGEYHTATELCELLICAQHGRLDDGFLGNSRTVWPERIWERLAKTPLLVIDEIGSRPGISGFAYDVLKRTIDCRRNKPAVFISNIDLPTLAKVYDDRITSRLAAGTKVCLDVPDRRIQR